MISHNIPGYQGRPFTPRYTVLHHTAGTNSLHICKYGRPGLPGPLCQYLISKDGTVHHITDGYANHVGLALPGFSNSNCIGVELENLGDGVDPYPAEQMESARDLCRALGLPVVGHKEICSPPGRKIDPSFDMDAFRASLEEEVPLQPDERNALLNINHWVKTSLKLGPYDSPMDVYGSFAAVQQTLTSLSDRIAALEARPPVVVEGGIDVDAIAKAVADKLAARLAD